MILFFHSGSSRSTPNHYQLFTCSIRTLFYCTEHNFGVCVWSFRLSTNSSVKPFMVILHGQSPKRSRGQGRVVGYTKTFHLNDRGSLNQKWNKNSTVSFYLKGIFQTFCSFSDRTLEGLDRKWKREREWHAAKDHRVESNFGSYR